MAEKKMYYSEEEAAAKLGCEIEQLTNYARDGKLQQYQDGTKKVYRASQVDELAGQLAAAPAEEVGEVELAPADTATGDAVSLSEAEATKGAAKEDTVITAEGISIFDDEDLEIEAADPMAKTQIAPSLEDQISLEGSGSGSGLLDLTRESDDTSLGAEVLDHIDMDSGIGAALETKVPEATYAPEPEAVAAEMPMVVEAVDTASGLFSGLLVGCALVALLLSVVMLSTMSGQAFTLVESLQDNMAIVLLGVTIVVGVCGAVGLLLGKSMASRQVATESTAQ